jgi:hypothetical protein
MHLKRHGCAWENDLKKELQTDCEYISWTEEKFKKRDSVSHRRDWEIDIKMDLLRN